jgi:hypothetical protein
VFGGEVCGGGLKKVELAGGGRLVQVEASRGRGRGEVAFKTGLPFDSRGKSTAQGKSVALMERVLGGGVVGEALRQQRVKTLPSWTKTQVLATAALFLLMWWASISSNGNISSSSSSSSSIFFHSPTPSHVLCSMYTSLGFTCSPPLPLPPNLPPNNMTNYFMTSGSPSAAAAAAAEAAVAPSAIDPSQSPKIILLFPPAQPPPPPPPLPPHAWHATFMFYIASGISRHGGSASPSRIYSLVDATCAPPAAEAALTRTALLQVGNGRRQCEAACGVPVLLDCFVVAGVFGSSV